MDVCRQLKTSLRAATKANLLSLPRAKLYRESFQITQQLVHSGPLYQNATHICFYSPMKHEIQLLGLLHKALSDQKNCFIPVVESRKKMDMFKVYSWKDYTVDFEKQGKYQIWEPKQLHFRDRLAETMDSDSRLLVLMPGVAFDRRGGRIGYGGGYYDRFLKSLLSRFDRDQITLVAPALETQILEEVPMTSDDIFIDALLTSRGIEWLNSQQENSLLDQSPVPSLLENVEQLSTPMMEPVISPTTNENVLTSWWRNNTSVSYGGLNRMRGLKELITHKFERIQSSEVMSEGFLSTMQEMLPNQGKESL